MDIFIITTEHETFAFDNKGAAEASLRVTYKDVDDPKPEPIIQTIIRSTATHL